MKRVNSTIYPNLNRLVSQNIECRTFIFDEEGHRVFSSVTWKQHYPCHDYPGSALSPSIIAPEHDWEEIFEIVKSGQEFTFRRKMVPDIDEWWKVKRCIDYDVKKPVGIIVLVMDINEIMHNTESAYGEITAREMERRISAEDAAHREHTNANKDTLTGLHNRRYFDRIYHQEIQQVEQYEHSISMMVIDIDHFKSVNDNHGHSIGDMVLKELAYILSKEARRGDYVCRWGGEEFVVLMIDVPLVIVEEVAERIRSRVESFIFTKVRHLTVSIGVSMYNLENPEDDHLFKRADSALYQAKITGRNKVVCLLPEIIE